MKRLLKTALALAAAGGTLVLGSSALAAQPNIMAQGELLSAAPAPSAVAPSAPLYSNVGTDAGTFLLNGGVNASGTRYTSTVCNRVTLSQPGSQQITAFSVVLHNENAAAFTPTSASVLFYDDSGVNGAPGVRLLNKAGIYYGGGNFGTGAMPAQSAFRLNSAPAGYTATYVPAPTASYVPKVWACAMFTGSNAQAAQLANLGLQKYTNAPTSGSTEDLAFVSTVGVVTPGNNPAGTLSAGTGAANVFGWELTTLGSNTLLDSYQVKDATGTTGTAGFSLNPGVGVEKNFSGYAATIDVPPLAAGTWNVSGLVLYPSCAVANYTSVQATIQLWNTFNGSAAPDVFGNTTPIASTTVDLGPFNCLSATSVYQFPVRLPTPISIGRSGTLGITVKYSADSGAGLVDGAFMEVIQTAPVASPLIAVGTNASTGNTGWYKSASNRADLNFTGATDYVTGTRQHTTLRVYADMVAPTHVVTTSTSGPGTGTISPGTGNVYEGATVTYKLTPAAGNHVVAVTGSCGGTLTGSTFVSAPIAADCTVNAVFAPGVSTNGIYQSPAMNHAILANSSGSTLNFVSGAWDDTGPSSGPWDFNPWASGGSLSFWMVSTYSNKLVLNGTTAAVLHAGDVVGPASVFSATGGTVAPAAAWLAGTDAYIGFQFVCNGRLANPVSGVCYGYAHLTTTATTGFPATLVDYTYDGDGNPITVGTVVRTLTSSVGTGSGLIDPLGTKTVTDGGTYTYTLMPNPGFHAGTIGGTCPAGTLTSNSYTTGAITANCTVIANFAPALSAPTITKAFAPASVTTGVNSTATITLTNPNASAITLSADLVDTLPSGLTVSGTATTTCGGTGVISNTTTSVKLASGATIPASASCTITASMQSATAGSYVNTIAAGALQTNAGNNAAAASATLTVTTVAMNPPTVANAFAPASVAVSTNSTATITLSNPNASVTTLSAALVDSLPSGLTVSGTATTTCGGTISNTATSVTLASGATIPGSGSCTITASMQSATAGSYVNTIAAGALQTNAGNNAAAAAATLTVTGGTGTNGIFRSPVVNHAVPATTAGTSLNLVSGVFDDTGPSGATALFDLNFWASSGSFRLWPIAKYQAKFVISGTTAAVLQAGDVVGPASTYSATGGTVTLAPAWLAGADAYLGFQFQCNGRLGNPVSGVCYGYAHIKTTGPTTGMPATVVEYSYDGDGNAITIGPSGPVAPTVSKSFAPAVVVVNTDSTATITLSNANPAVATLSANLVDTLPGGLVASSATTTCGGTASFTAGAVTLGSGATIPASGSCTISATVRSATVGSYVNTIAAGALQTDKGNNAAAASATLGVTTATLNPPTIAKAFAPASVPVSTNSTATITLTNPNASAITLGADLVDTLPSGLVASAAATTCGGTASFTAGTLKLGSGATLPAGASCTLTGTVQSATVGSYVNTIAAGALQTNAGNNAAAASATLTVTAAAFPAPYCAMAFPSNVEPITRVKFTGVDNTSSATLNGSPALENFLSVAGGTVSRGGVYSMAVEGNTDGNFTTKIKVYIDWNHNGVFDADESYVIGDLANSTGTDGKQAVADIAVPAGALVGPTRMRVTKRFSAAAVACETTGFGQGEDYTLTVDSLPPPLPNANITPSTFNFVADVGASATGTMTVSNSGPGRLTFNVQRALAERQAAAEAASKATLEQALRHQNDMQKLALSGEVPLPAAVDMLTASKGYLPKVGGPGMFASDPACDASASGIIVHDHDGIPDNGYGWNASAGTTARIVDKFTPSTYPGTFNTACLSLLTNAGLTSAAVKIVVYADDGAGGAPGTQLGSVSATANNIGTGLVTQFQAFDISSMNLSIASGSVYIGVEWNASAITGLYLGVDETSATSAGGYQYTTAWDLIVNTRPNYKAMYIRAVEGNAGPPGVGCDAPSNVAWLSTTPSSGTINGVGSMDVTVKANATGMAVGSYSAQLCVNTNDAAHPRFEIPVSFTVNPVGPPDLIFKDGFDGAGSGGPGMYTDRATFVSHVAAGFYENPFADAVPGPSPPLSYTQGGIAYTVTSSIPDGGTGGGLYNDTGLISTNGSGAAIVVTFTGTPVTAVGGNFWATDVNVAANGLDIVIALSDGTTETFTSTGPSDFRGFTTSAPITSITIDAPNPSDPTDGSWSAMDNLIVGSGN